MKRLTGPLILLLIAAFGVAQPATKDKHPLVAGEVLTMHSAVLNEDRILNIILPDSFNSEKKYPVIYLLDGSVNEDLPHIAGLLQFFRLSYSMPDCILVGIANVDRRRDFTFPTTVAGDKKSFPTTGESGRFIRFISTELKPYIGSVFRSSGNDYLIGQSLGGLLAMEILLKNPELFSNYLIVSPSLWWDSGSLLQAADSLILRRGTALENKRIFISAGGKEDAVMQHDAKKFAGAIDSAGKKNTQVRFFLLPEENHVTILHQAINEDLKQLFPYKE